MNFTDTFNTIEVKDANLTVAKDGKEVSVKVKPEGQKDDKSSPDKAPFEG